MQINQKQQFSNPIYNLLTPAKSLPKLSQAPPLSIYPLIHHSQFINYRYQSQQNIQPPQIYTNPHTQLHKTKQNFKDIFQQYIYKSHQNALSDKNDSYGQIHINNFEGKFKKLNQFPCYSQNQLNFQSRFQSGNLLLAAKSKITLNEYNLLLHKDINSKSCTQWFYFKVSNNKILGKIRFNILNFTKQYSAYHNGMKICVYSIKKLQNKNIGWTRQGEDIAYRQNTVQNQKPFYTLSFTYNFQYLNDTVQFAYSYPYTYTKLQNFLQKFQNSNQSIVNRKRITETPAGNHIQMVTITNNNTPLHRKPIIFITARVHPGQTISSFICEGLLQSLVNTKQSQIQKLLNQFIFKIIPMLNPDGVIHGNYRCSIKGIDLNRSWKKPDKIQTPQIYYVKQLIKQSKGDKLLYIDLHGHSKRKGIFAYGCSQKANPFKCKQFPYLLHKKLNFFNYYFCNFSVTKNLFGTARINLWKELKIPYSYTLETSFFGPCKQNRHFSVIQYKNIGRELLICIYLYFYNKKQKKEIQQIEIKQILADLYKSEQLLNAGDGDSEFSSDYQQIVVRKQKVNIIESKIEKIFKDNNYIGNSPSKLTKMKLDPIIKFNFIKQDKQRRQVFSSNNNKSTFIQQKIKQINLQKKYKQTDFSSQFGSFSKSHLSQKIYSYYKIKKPQKFDSQQVIAIKIMNPDRKNAANLIFSSPDRQSYTNYQKTRKNNEKLKIFMEKNINDNNYRQHSPNITLNQAVKRFSFQLHSSKSKNL